MDNERCSNESDSNQEIDLQYKDHTRGYSYVGKQIGNDIPGKEIQRCPKCNAKVLIRDVRKWRNTGAGLICDVCAGVKPGKIVANDNYEVLKVNSDHSVVLPERLRKKNCI